MAAVTNSRSGSPSTFLGRGRELAEASELLGGSGLLTITGPGGVGKTRFALELARRLHEAGLVEERHVSFLAPLRDATLVLPTIARTLELREQPGHSALETIAARLESRRAVIVLDNLEHLISCRNELAELATTCPCLALLVTSRQKLGVAPELEYDLSPLELEEGIALFCERARVEPSAAVGELTARLEGLPLAIELAAARTGLLTAEQLLARLSRRLDVLKSRSSVEPRHETLRTAIEWSYDLLSPHEQAAFRGLSVFVGGCAAEDVNAVASRDTLESLVQKSLVRRSETQLGPRFWMLETIREFAADALERAGERESAHAAHLVLHLRLAEKLAPARYGMETREERLRFQAEQANFRAALSRAVRLEDAETALRLVRYLGDMLHASPGYRASLRAFRDALALQGGAESDRAYALLHASRLEAELGRASEYRLLSASCEAMFESLDDMRGLWQVVQERAFFEQYFGSSVEAIRAGERAIEIARGTGDRALEMMATATLAGVLVESQSERDTPDRELLRRSRELYERVTAWARREGSAVEEWVSVSNFAYALSLMGDYEQALDAGQQALRVAVREEMSPASLRGNLLWIGSIAVRSDLSRTGAVLVAAARSLYKSEGLPLPPTEERQRAEAEALARAALGDEEYDEAVREGEQLTPDDAIALALHVRTDAP